MYYLHNPRKPYKKTVTDACYQQTTVTIRYITIVYNFTLILLLPTLTI